MTEQLIANIIEKSVIAGAFVFMLYHFMGRFSQTLDSIGETLQSVSQTLLAMNTRLDSIERRMDRIEREKEVI